METGCELVGSFSITLALLFPAPAWAPLPVTVCQCIR